MIRVHPRSTDVSECGGSWCSVSCSQVDPISAHRSTFIQNPAPPDAGAVVGGAVDGVDADAGATVVGVGEFWVWVVPPDPHAAAPAPSRATQTIDPMRLLTLLLEVLSIRVISRPPRSATGVYDEAGRLDHSL